jgi:hypothetical protein
VPEPSLASRAARTAGAALAGVFGGTAVVRRGRPLHPRGVTCTAVVTMTGEASSGVPWLDEAATTPVTVRASRATGLPAPLPDIYGLALRVPRPPTPDGSPAPVADILFASTGDSRYGRFALMAHRRLGHGPLTTLLPLRAPSGPLLLRLAPVEGARLRDEGPVLGLPQSMSLSYAVGRGPWAEAGELLLGPRVEGESDTRRHDPVVHELPGTEQYDVVRRLREPAYRAARRVPVRPHS